MGDSINEANAATKESGPINKIEACDTAVLKLQNVENLRQWYFDDKS